jgi:C4-dicarboxylate-specific signal transduction histidine kinase
MRRTSLVILIALFPLSARATPAASGRAAPADERKPSPFTVSGDVALHALMALADGHLRKTADVLGLLAETDAVRSGDWERIRRPLAKAAEITIPAVLWFARRDGDYWTAPLGRAPGNLAGRDYFPRLLAGKSVLGDLVVSQSTGRNTAIVAVPVRGERGIVGALGASVYLDRLGEIVRGEMGGLDPDLIFFAIDGKPIGALHSDPSLIFTDPMKLGDESMRRAFRQILSSDEGTVTYPFRGRARTMLYRKSAFTGWWYALGTAGHGP